MLPEERRQALLEYIRAHRAATVEALARRFFASEATVRRDLADLAGRRLLRRTHGGALALEGLESEIPMSVREAENRRAKEAIAAAAAARVRDGDVLVLDSSSTALRMVPHLAARQDLTILTNGAKAALALAELRRFRVYGTGGILRDNSLSFVGPRALDFLRSFHADRVFFSTRAFSLEKGVTDVSEEEAELRRAMLDQAREAVYLCDSSKLGTVSFSFVCPVSRLDVLVMDRPSGLSADALAEALRAPGVRLEIV